MKYDFDIIIIGGGVSGLVSALELTAYSNLNVAILEAGNSFDLRNNNQLTGLGGAGVLAGAKLCLPPASNGVWKKTGYSASLWERFINLLPLKADKKIKAINAPLGMYSNHGEFSEKTYKSIMLLKDEMHQFVIDLIFNVKQQGVSIFTKTAVEKVKKKENGFIVATNNSDLYCKKVVYAGGRSGASSFAKIFEELDIDYQTKSHDLGIRLDTSRLNTETFGVLGKDVKIKTLQDGFLVRSFCVCSGGMSTKVSLSNYEYWDGHFGDKITNRSNIGFMAREISANDINANLYLSELQEFANEKFALSEFLKIRFLEKFIRNEKVLNVLIAIRKTLQKGILTGIFDFDLIDSTVQLPAIDNYTLSIATDSKFETSCKGVYVVGDANGLSRGYIQSLWSGFVVADSILSKEVGNIFINDLSRRSKIC